LKDDDRRCSIKSSIPSLLSDLHDNANTIF
jgi:hypothetical protein